MVEPQNIKILQDKFFSDPDWVHMEQLLLDYIEPLKDMNSVDTTQPAEHVKAEIIGRNLAYESIDKFIRDNKIVRRLQRPIKSKFI